MSDLPTKLRADELVPGKEAIQAALAANHADAVQLRRLKKMRDDLDDLARGKTPKEEPGENA